ncbi:YmgD family protein [Aliiruegeria lutimaris]|uniref:YmgD protein n=1 Tax=Aliiruegeria lutimaris TaxID=571298 RepID=A0A1G8VCR8_9RHOB|nr:YmgD family protein [Aliiruegeria lutimaris]SDJ63657.1 YmgD protein [Aliiruegeria lutimaris]
MTQRFKSSAAVAVCLFTLGGTVQADEIMDQAIASAQPYMHHSCGSVLDTFGDDEDQVAEIVRLMAMVSLFNRQIDVMAEVPEEQDRARLKDEFVEELEDACDDDPGMLLAGAVDLAVRETFRAFD